MPLLENGTNYPLAPQAFAETAPQFWPSYWMPRLGMTLETAFASYGTLYRTQPWVATVVNKVSDSVARLGTAVWDQSPATGQELDLDGPFARLIANPCPTMPPHSFWFWTSAYIEIYGEAYWIKLRENPKNGQVTGFTLMHPSLTQIYRDTDGEEMYRFLGRPGVVFPRSDIVPFRRFNPDNSMRGVSRMESLRSTLLNEDSARRSMAATWKNGTAPSGVIHSPKALGTDGRERLKAAFQSEHQGTGNHGRVLLLEDDVTFLPLETKAAVDMAFTDARKLNREEVCAVYDVPPAAVQNLDHATFSNVTENMRSLYRDTMAPRIEFIESVVNWEVGSEFYGNKVMKFAVDEVLRGAFEQRADAIAKLVQCGVMKLSEARQFFDLNVAGPEADQLYMQGAMVPVRSADEDPAPAIEPPTHVPAIGSGQGTDVPRPADPSPAVQKHIRDMSGLLGRGRTLQDAARQVIDKTGDQDGVRQACEYLLERRIT